ncbi:S1 RNA-binding domain-containing protein [Actinoallomurus iriomotensis]|uniref:S1 motif domain-containing protein n=1 Tax=Actinoallomurus iriomotensis TaxID=478107 RepID=A0A9W6RKS3_9ACTN|nr:S1 RNA-binding domain-containing protein [Actinoallomurus iriomotensis]GLY77503.1 hypothetical protein Airi01_057700 [Actinoallomurus iriomotensis]
MSQPHTPAPLSAWQDFLARHAEGGALDGRVASVVPFGAFVEVADGIHGLLPSVEWTTRPEVGADIRVRVNVVDIDRRRMSLLPA